MRQVFKRSPERFRIYFKITRSSKLYSPIQIGNKAEFQNRTSNSFFFSKNLTSLARIPEIVRSYFARTINRFNIITIFSLDERENPRYNCNER